MILTPENIEKWNNPKDGDRIEDEGGYWYYSKGCWWWVYIIPIDEEAFYSGVGKATESLSFDINLDTMRS